MPAGVDKISTAQKYVLARRRLVKLINNRAKLLSLCSFIIETCLFILWRHLEYYLLHCTPTDSQDSLFASRSLFKSRRLQDSFASESNLDFRSGLTTVSQHDIDQLLADAISAFENHYRRNFWTLKDCIQKCDLAIVSYKLSSDASEAC